MSGTLQEIYLPAFEAAVTQGHARTLVCSYNRLNGDHASASHYLLPNLEDRVTVSLAGTCDRPVHFAQPHGVALFPIPLRLYHHPSDVQFSIRCY